MVPASRMDSLCAPLYVWIVLVRGVDDFFWHSQAALQNVVQTSGHDPVVWNAVLHRDRSKQTGGQLDDREHGAFIDPFLLRALVHHLSTRHAPGLEDRLRNPGVAAVIRIVEEWCDALDVFACSILVWCDRWLHAVNSFMVRRTILASAMMRS